MAAASTVLLVDRLMQQMYGSAVSSDELDALRRLDARQLGDLRELLLARLAAPGPLDKAALHAEIRGALARCQPTSTVLPFLLFGGSGTARRGGWHDLLGSFATYEAAALALKDLQEVYASAMWSHIVDRRTGDVLTAHTAHPPTT